MGCICAQTTQNSDLNTGKDPSVKVIQNNNAEDPNSVNNLDIFVNSKSTFRDNHQIYQEKVERMGISESPIPTPTKLADDAAVEVEVINPKTDIDRKKEYLRNDDDSVDNVSGISKAKRKKKKFDSEITDIINNFRQNPSDFKEKLLGLIPYIKPYNDKIIFSKKGQPKILMNTGESAVYSVIKLIETLAPMSKLEQNKEIAIVVPPNPEHWTSQYSFFVEQKTADLKDNSKIKYNLLSFHFDLSISDPELSFLLQLVDDNSFNGLRRSHICDPEMKYIAVTYANVGVSQTDNNEKKYKDKKFCSYFTFAK